ncbi:MULTISPECIES: MFS transporter [Acidithiobacillus]|jgi:putative MFS transporter|uniref:MFS transporter n=6 Tax=Acidithiobacillus caldus TaxID=33059 RepID=B7SV04_9PROT|nr:MULTISPECIES: MFS transporter [Acidithiobacillus]ACI62966.1 major facilitator family transporter [Acidithiobacillus caldus]AIA54982.1 General substrate transporter [Acidithiobacillus caldus ATCC 51756]MBU2731000.1 MFS transporter [Acidithiobacillus caldus]MBU2735986.1 MFS transporter [Acidithiobacillus caldus ATCC 51756]MBU2763122.1 MFS transporter [Acidithiobacillus caldus]
MSAVFTTLDEQSITRRHRRVLWASGLGIFLDGYDLSIMAIALIVLKDQWHPSSAALGLLGTAALVGALVGGLLGGPIADRFGRKTIYLIDIAAFFFAALLSGFAWDIASLVAFRFLLGLGVGADYPLSSTYMAEFMPKDRRGAVMTWIFGLWMGGAVVSSLVGLALLHTGPDAWRWMLASGALPAILVLWMRRNLPESPRWYLRRGRVADAERVVAWLAPQLSAAERRAALEETAAAMEGARRHSWLDLFGKRYLKLTLYACIPWFMMDVMGYALAIFLPLMLLHLGLKTNEQAVIGNTLFSLAFVIGWIPLALLIDRIGRRRAQIIGFLGDALGLGLVGVLLVALGEPPFWAVATGLLLFQISNSFGPGTTTWIIPTELYPTELRASGHGFATAVSRLGAATSVFLLPTIQATLGEAGLLFLLAGAGGVGVVTTLWLGNEMARESLPESLARKAA